MHTLARKIQGRGVVGMQDGMELDVVDAASGRSLQTVQQFVGDHLGPQTSVIYLVGCGGSLYMFGAMAFLLEASPIPVIAVNSAEFVARHPAGLGPQALVIASSTHGTTHETAEAITFAREHGAPVLLVCQNDDNECARAAGGVVAHHNGVEAKQVLLAAIAHEILSAQQAVPSWLPSPDVLRALGPVFRETNAVWDDQLTRIAAEIADAGHVFVVGSGPNEGAAETFAACYLMEMQNLIAVPSGGNDFLHGTHEMVEESTAVVVLVGEDHSRPIAERAATFTRTYSQHALVLDSTELPMDGVAPEHRGVVSALLFASSVIARLAQHVEAATERPLISRKYMWKVDY